MKLFTFLSITLLFLSCAKEAAIIHPVPSHFIAEKADSFEGLLKFELREYSYGIEDNEFSVYSAKQEEAPIKIYRAKMYYNPKNFEPILNDSVLLHVPVNYKIIKPDSTTIDSITLSFDYWEDINNLEPITETEYVYSDKELFFKTLSKQDLRQGLYSTRASMFDFSFLDPALVSYYGSNKISAWYFEDEKLEITRMEWNKNDESIQVAGSFEAYIKTPSCGWWVTHEVRNAYFAIKI